MDMEAIIIYIIMIIIFSVLKSLKDPAPPAGRKPSPFSPGLPAGLPRFPGLDLDLEPAEQKTEKEKGGEILHSGREPVFWEAPEKDWLLPKPRIAEERKKMVSPKALRAAKKATPPMVSPTVSPIGGSGKKTISPPKEAVGNLELGELIGSEKLPTLILISEILSAPRSREPYRARLR
ncbi:MAG: hypothetical protein ACOX6X_04355 [Dethiobacteria bacterium]|jgi:hypothetical protein